MFVLAAASAVGCTAEVDGNMQTNPANAGGTGGGPGGASAIGGGNSGGTTMAGGAGGSLTVAQGIDLSGAPKYYRVVRLTNEQWARSVQEVLKLAQPTTLAASFQGAVSGATAFSNNELLLDVNERAWTDFQAAAEALAEQVTTSDAALAAVYAGTDAAGFIKAVGRRAFRRPLTDAEVTSYSALFDKGSAMSGTKSTFAKGAALVIRSFLQSPKFLYRTELSPSGSPLNGYEVTAKLSLWLRGASPGDALLDAAPTLTTPEAVATQATALLGEASAPQVLREFYRELLHLDRYTQLSKPNVPTYAETINAELQESSYLFFDKLLKEGLGLRDLLTSTRGFVGPQMAPLYGLTSSGSGYVEQELGAKRAGYFSQLPYLMLNAFDAEPDSIHRGVNLNLDVLCAPLGTPGAVPPLPPLQPGQTNRQRISTLTAVCGGECHNQMINPIGFAFEHFDGMGQYQDMENGGLPIDSSGSYAFTEGVANYADNVALMGIMAESEQAHLCYAKKLAGFGLQRDIVVSDLTWLNPVAAVSKTDKGSIKQVVAAIAKSDAFRTHLGGVK